MNSIFLNFKKITMKVFFLNLKLRLNLKFLKCFKGKIKGEVLFTVLFSFGVSKNESGSENLYLGWVLICLLSNGQDPCQTTDFLTVTNQINSEYVFSRTEIRRL